MAARREEREHALNLLYESDLRNLSPHEVLASQLAPPEAYTAALVEGVGNHVEEIEQLLGKCSDNWSVERMPVVDRSILRLATYELGWSAEVPTAVVLNEAVELAKTYSTEESGKFVNGVLARIAEELRAA